MNQDKKKDILRPGLYALLPIGVFLVVYLLVSVVAGDFNKVPLTVAFVLSSVVAVGVSKEKGVRAQIDRFCHGAGETNIMLMIVIFILAGCFAGTAARMGAVTRLVDLALNLLPPRLITVGIFAAACFISLSMGTSVGTIVALAPIAVGIASRTEMSEAMMLGITVSGAMFGDNLSFISDTTIVATRTQGCRMADKFKVNFRIAFPVAVVSAIIFWLMGGKDTVGITPVEIDWLKVLPYLTVLVASVAGLNVMIVLLLGIGLSGSIGMITGSFDLWGWNSAMGSGIAAMGELITVTLLAGGMLETIRYNGGGGIQWIIDKIGGLMRSRKSAEASIGALVGLSDICTANNTVALIISGPIAKDIAEKYDIDPRRSASLLDIFSCVVQGIIPYGAQLLMASGLGAVSPLEIMPYLVYPYLLGAGAVLSIATGYPRRYSGGNRDKQAGNGRFQPEL